MVYGASGKAFAFQTMALLLVVLAWLEAPSFPPGIGCLLSVCLCRACIPVGRLKDGGGCCPLLNTQP